MDFGSVKYGVFTKKLIILEGGMKELSWIAIKDLASEGIKFPTPKGKDYYSIANTNDENKTFTFWRTTGKESFVCKYSNVEKVAQMVRKGQIKLNTKEVDMVISRFGSYITALLMYFGY